MAKKGKEEIGLTIFDQAKLQARLGNQGATHRLALLKTEADAKISDLKGKVKSAQTVGLSDAVVVSASTLATDQFNVMVKAKAAAETVPGTMTTVNKVLPYAEVGGGSFLAYKTKNRTVRNIGIGIASGGALELGRRWFGPPAAAPVVKGLLETAGSMYEGGDVSGMSDMDCAAYVGLVAGEDVAGLSEDIAGIVQEESTTGNPALIMQALKALRPIASKIKALMGQGQEAEAKMQATNGWKDWRAKRKAKKAARLQSRADKAQEAAAQAAEKANPNGAKIAQLEHEIRSMRAQLAKQGGGPPPVQAPVENYSGEGESYEFAE